MDVVYSSVDVDSLRYFLCVYSLMTYPDFSVPFLLLFSCSENSTASLLLLCVGSQMVLNLALSAKSGQPLQKESSVESHSNVLLQVSRCVAN